MMAHGPRPNGWIGSVPNLLSVLRLALAAAFPFAPASTWLAILVLAGLSDWVDGWVARRFDAATPLGGLLDAVADKAFVLSALLTLAWNDRIGVWWVPLLLVRDLAVAAMSLVNATTSRPETWGRFWRSRWFGRATTAVLFALLATILAWPEATLARGGLLGAAVLLNALAAADYLVQYRRVRAHPPR